MEPAQRSSGQGPSSFGALLEKIEIMRSSLRWPQSLTRPQIEKLLRQTGTLREEVLKLSRTERLVRARTANPLPEAQTVKERRAALLDRDFQFDGVFGDSPRLIEALEIAEKAAPTDLPVLIDGESGTGKELMAKVVHANGSRAQEALITVNCGAIPDNLLESELFGHKRGAFTGASSDRAGKFEAANGGTIFLDEIGELPLNGQVKLLRVLQSNEIQRVGSDQIVKVDARIVAATNRDLKQMCRDGTFREDLYYRLGIIQITIPPLRERRDEISLLIDYLNQEACDRLNRPTLQFSTALKKFLFTYSYPGNVRELRNLILRLACLADVRAELEHLPEDVRRGERSTRPLAPLADTTAAAPADQAPPATAGGAAEADQPPGGEPAEALDPGILPTLMNLPLAEAKRVASDFAEKQVLEAGLRRTTGNVTALAKELQMNRAHVQTLLKKHNIASKDFRAQATDRKPAEARRASQGS
ncbi:MAG: sigma 54-interacting transcriptional regulator [Pseudomonadota bacterium]